MERAPRQARPRLASLSGLAPPERDPNELETTELSRKMLVVAAIRVAAVTLTLGALVAFGLVPAVPGRTWQYVLIGGVYALSLAYVFVLRRRPLVVPLAYVQVVFDSVIVSLVVLMTGGIESIFSFAYMIVAVEGAILLYRRGAVTALVSDFLMYGTILLIQIDHYWSAMPEVLFGPAIFSFSCTKRARRRWPSSAALWPKRPRFRGAASPKSRAIWSNSRSSTPRSCDPSRQV